MKPKRILLPFGGATLALAASPAFAQAVSKDYQFFTFAVFGAIIAVNRIEASIRTEVAVAC